MKTTLFNIHVIQTKFGELSIEFYAGNIFDIPSDVLVLSAFKNCYSPAPGTTWGELYKRTGQNFSLEKGGAFSENIKCISDNQNQYYKRLFALDLIEISNFASFTLSNLRLRYNELGKFFEEFDTLGMESVSMPIPGTGNQGISHADSIDGLMRMCLGLKNTRFKIIRIFAYDFQAIGELNMKINSLLNRATYVTDNLLSASIDNMKAALTHFYSDQSVTLLNNLIFQASASNSALNILAISGRRFAENVSTKLSGYYEVPLIPDCTLDQKLKELTPFLKKNTQQVLSYLRLLQAFGNMVAHSGLNISNQDAVAIIIAVLRIMEFTEALPLKEELIKKEGLSLNF